MKTKLFLFLTLCMSGTLFAQTFNVGGINYDVTSATTVQVGSNSGFVGSAVIPSSVTYLSNNYSVTSIRFEAFSNCTTLTTVTVPNTVIRIEMNAFRYCTNLTSVNLPNSLNDIQVYAFGQCYSLTSINIPTSLTSISKGLFFLCVNLTSITLPNSVTHIGASSFEDCHNLASINMSNSLIDIEYYAFLRCNSLTSISLPNTITSIGEAAFSNCTSLASVTVNKSTPILLSYINFVFSYPAIYSMNLYVPACSIPAYQNAEVWQNFIINAIPGSETIPTFTQITPVCTLTTVSPLPTTSLEGITGTWSPAFDNTAPPFTITTTTYTFTPNAGQCGTTTTMNVQVYPLQDILFIPIDPICSGDTLIPPPNTSLNGVTGSWSPAFNNMVTTTYTFTPDPGYCAVPRTLTITVNSGTPTFSAIAPICSGATLSPLPTTSLEGLTGTWSPALNNTASTTYTFTPDAGQCALTTTMTIVVTSQTLWYSDSDNDGFGNPSSSLSACIQPVGYVSNNNDCDDTQILYQDLDNDGLGSYIEVACGVDNTNDCDDTSALVNYYAFHRDVDGDGFGQSLLTLVCAPNATSPPQGYSLIAGDCNDNNPLSHSEFIFFLDNDGDGYGGIYQIYLCANAANMPPPGFSANSLDCNDSNAAIHPGATEICNDGIDNDCDGVVDNGCIQRTTVISPTLCGTTLPTISTLIRAVQYPGATDYIFEVTNTSVVPNVVYPPINPPLTTYYFDITQMPGYDYSTTYSIRVMIKYNGIWVGYYGPPCSVTTPSLTQNGLPQISQPACGSTLTSLSSNISTPGLAGVKCYRFKVTNTLTGAVQTIDKCAVPPATIAIPWFSLTMLANYNYGTTYQIEVAVSSNGVSYSPYGLPCNVNTPRVPALTNYCGLLVPTKSTLINTANMAFVTVYRFEVTNLSTNSVKIIDKGIAPLPLQSYFNLNNLVTAPSIYSANTNYSVRVALKTGGTYSPFGLPCIITSPNIAKLSEVQEPIITNVFDVIVSPNPFDNQFEISLQSNDNSKVSIMVYDMLGRLIDDKIIKANEVSIQQLGTNYPSGVYNVIVSQATNQRSFKMIKR